MSDPAIESAQRAIGKVARSEPYRWAEQGAREMSAAIRELHCVAESESENAMESVCATCFSEEGNPVCWPCPTARLVYSTDELEAMKK